MIMMRERRTITLCVAPVLGAVLALGSAGGATAIEQGSLKRNMSGISIPFIENVGQSDSRVAYYAPTRQGTCFVTVDGVIVHSLPSKGNPQGDSATALDGGMPAGWVLTETPIGARTPVVEGEAADLGVSIFHGDDPKRWRAQVPAHEDVSLGERWPGVELTLRAHEDSVEKLFTVRPGGSTESIRMRIDGAACLRISESGDLLIATGLGDVQLARPVAFQENTGGRRMIDVAYRLIGDDGYGFSIGPYDSRLPVVIDPVLQATYLGGSSNDTARAITVHPINRDVYICGSTSSTNFPGTAGGAQPTFGGGTGDAFVARLNPDLTALVQATFIGGSLYDTAHSLAIQPGTGDVFLAGLTFSTNLPGTGGGAQPASGGGGYDAFVVRLGAGLTTLLQSTYLGGTSTDDGWSIAIHPMNGDAYVTGSTSSANFPGTGGGAQAASGGGTDAYVARLNPSLTTLVQSSYVGGSSHEYSSSVVISPTTGDVYIGEYTESTDLPGTAGGAQAASGGSADAFVARMSSSLTTLMQATYLGGVSDDWGFRIGLNSASGDIYLCGTTRSTGFPGTSGGAQAAPGGGTDAFLARLSGDLTTLMQSTYFGGTGNDDSYAMSLRSSTGDIYVGGETASLSLPGMNGALQPAYGGGSSDAFVARFNSALTSLTQATYLGGSDWEYLLGLTTHPTSGDLYLCGTTGSANFPGTAGGAQQSRAGPDDAFAARITSTLRSGPSIAYITSKTSKPGRPVTIYGEGFSASASNNKVYFGKKKARVSRAKTNRLKVTIPNNLKSGLVDVKVVVNGKESNKVQFLVK